MNRLIVTTIFTVAILLGLAGAAPAQRKYAVRKNIVLKPGASSARIVGVLPNNIEIHEYHFQAKAGQKMTVDLVSNDKDIGFYIMTIPDGYVLTEDIDVRSFDDTLPDTGEYTLFVATDTRRGSKYALEITIRPRS